MCPFFCKPIFLLLASKNELNKTKCNIYILVWKMTRFPQLLKCLVELLLKIILLQFHNNTPIWKLPRNDFWFNFQPVIQSDRQIPISSTLSLHSAVIYHLSNKINLFSCPCAGWEYWDRRVTSPGKQRDNRGGFTFIPAPRLHFLSRCQISACAHFQLKQTAGLVYNISLIILMAWILDNGEQREKIAS